ncbi:hypothetical protein [Chitinophaga sp. S165]|uniref:hypothetical protein n=1 Tax=Chitinophaga sp. S165 TaxID=2135462 RepID=UPI000D70C31D|nr:hypothetical protein [Chitinophaga sp. S165]PWV50607.1 hypothetical protein C7475_104236 [Chitinophaga sp. S165]
MQNKTNAELVALLDNEEMRDDAAMQLLQQSPSQNDLVQIIRRELHNKKAAWELYKSRATKEELYGDIHWIHVRDWLEEPLLKFDLNQEQLYRFLTYGGGREATWQRLLKTSPGKRQLLDVLERSGYRNEVAAYLLTQPDDNELLSYIVQYTDHGEAAWKRLKKNNPDKDCLETAMKSDYAAEAWELYLRFPVEKFDLYVLMHYNERMTDIVAAELLRREPTQKDLLEIVGHSSLWQPAWEELLKRGIGNFELASLIYGTRFKELAWEQLKKQSPTLHELLGAINYEDEDNEYNAIIGAYMLQCSPTNQYLCYLIDYVAEVRDAAIDMLLKQSPNEKERELIAEYRFSDSEIAKSDVSNLHSENDLMEIFEHEYEKKKDVFEQLQRLNLLSAEKLKVLYKNGYGIRHLIWEEARKDTLTKDDLVYYYCYADSSFRGEIWEQLTENGLDKTRLVEIIKFGLGRPAGDLLLQQSPIYEQLYLIMKNNTDEDILRAAFLKAMDLPLGDRELHSITFISEKMAKIAWEEWCRRGNVTDDQLFYFIRDTVVRDQAWELLKSRPKDNELLVRLLEQSYSFHNEIWEFMDEDMLSFKALTDLIIAKRKPQECAAVLRRRLGMEAEDERALKLRIALKVIDGGGGLLVGEHHAEDAHSLAGWAVLLSVQDRKVEAEHGTLVTACALIPSLGKFLASGDLEEIRQALVAEKFVKD